MLQNFSANAGEEEKKETNPGTRKVLSVVVLPGPTGTGTAICSKFGVPILKGID
jgi:hypothetical protein